MPTEQSLVYRAGITSGKRLDSRTQVANKQRAEAEHANRHPPLVTTDPRKAASLKAIRLGSPGNTTGTQLDRILVALKKFKASGINTMEAREHLGTPHPAGRVQQLRDLGHEIITQRVRFADDAGDTHPVANYILVQVAGGSEVRS